MKAKSDIKGLCWKCLKVFDEVTIIKIEQLGYGSCFDGWSTEIHLCEDCLKDSNKEIWNMDVVVDGYCEEYKHEEAMIKYINSLPLVSKQFVFNEFDTGWDARVMNPQDWIDYEEGVLSHLKCKEYGLYSFEEIDAYKTRFPKCEYPVNRVYKDGSVGCWCPFGATGDVNQETSINISSDCYKCPYFKKRVSILRDIANEDWKDYKLYVMSTVKKEELEKKFKVSNG